MESQSEWFKPLCIMALVFGLGGMCCDLWSLAGLFGGDMLASLGNEQLKASLEAQRPFRPWMMLLGFLNIVQSFALALGAALSLRNVQRHGPILRAGLLGGLVLAPIGLAVGLLMQFTTMGKTTAAALPAEMKPIMLWGTVVAGTGWVLVKMIFFVLVLRMLRKQREGTAPAS